MKDFKQHFSFFKEKIINNENFAFSRFSDGEMFILQNKELKLDDNLIQMGDKIQSGPYKKDDFKHFDPKQHQSFQKQLIKAFKYRTKNYYKGISCSCCVGKENFDWQINLHGGDDDSLTWANLWVNNNYPQFIQEILPLFYSKKCVFVGNKNANIKSLPFVVKDFRVGYNAMVNDTSVIDEMGKWIKENNIKNHIFLFSASSFTNIAIYELFKDNANNTFIDIGTCLTPMMDMPTERDYLQGFWGYRGSNSLNLICKWN
tara:strand:- start:1330 stop:2106 length:777 start_codon:yes stop_codon:yes gene_type:complete